MDRTNSTLLLAILALLATAGPSFAQSVLLEVVGDGYQDKIGSSIRPIEDVDGDGEPDLVVGTRSPQFQVRSGADGSLIYSVNEGELFFGWNVDVIADVDGDGISEILTGAPYDDTNGENSGRASLYSGADGAVLFTIYGQSGDGQLGLWVSRAGDVNGDGFEDVLLGSPGADTPAGYNAGFVRVVSGLDGALLFELQGEQAEDLFGRGLAPAGDVNGDGFDDFAVGSPGHGVPQTATPLGSGKVELFAGPDGVELAERVGQPQEQLGASIARVGRVNGDAVDDLVIGAPGYFTPLESAYVVSGVDLSNLRVLRGDVDLQEFGERVSGAGDVDGDGTPDVLVGAQFNQVYDSASGMARLFSGATGDPLYTVYGQEWQAQLGVGVAAVGDRDGDGHDDIAVGETGFDGTSTNLGRVRILRWAGGTSFTRYCSANPNSTGSPAEAAVDGTGSVGTGGLVLRAHPVPTNQPGIWFYGPGEAHLPFGDGIRCVSGPIYRLSPPSSAGSEQLVEHALSYDGPPAGAGAGQIHAGSTWKFQAWYRDPNAGPGHFNTSNAVSIDFVP